VPFDDFPAVLPVAPTPVQTGEPNAQTEAALLYTSGTTGRPKGCVLTNEYFHTFGMNYLTLGGALTMSEGVERLYNPLPLHHANCLSISLPSMLIAGGCLIFPDRFHASTWWKDVVSTRATVAQFQGVIPNILLKLAPCDEERQHTLRFALCAGVEPSQHEVFEKRFGLPLVEMWAMTETGRMISDNHEPRAIHTRAFGRVSPWIEARAVDEHGNEVPPGEPGELVIRHSAATPRKGFFSGYLKNEEATETAWKGGWFHTGDAVMRDAQGVFYFMDRKKNIIRRAGENIAAAEIEACLTAHDLVKQVAVLAAPDEVREERRARFMEVAEEVSAKRIAKKVGKTLNVLVDEINADGGIGRTAADAPEIDGVVYIAPTTKASKRYKVGDFVSVKITGADGHDLWGEV
jgi:crotonobetaine/carnitine-CoA ligase